MNLLVSFNTCRDGQGAGLHLVSHLADRFWGWSDKHDSCVGAGLSEVRTLREETVAWMDGVHVVVLRSGRGTDEDKGLLTYSLHFCALNLLV